jgi:DNA-binding MarR family transcriptional regulator
MMEPAVETRQEQEVSLAGLTDSIGFLLRMAQLKVFAQFFEDLGKYGLKPGEFSVLVLIGENPGVRQGQIAAAMKIKPAHMTKMVRGFEDQGLVDRSVPPDDRRAVELRLSEKGKDYVGELSPHFYAFDRSQQEPLTKSEMQTMRGLLRKFNGYPETPVPHLFNVGVTDER